jgi:hypothetical protein
MLIYFAFHIIFIRIEVGLKRYLQPNGGPTSNGNGNGNGNHYPKYVTLDENLSRREKKRRIRDFLISEKEKYRRTYEKARDKAKYNYEEAHRNFLTDIAKETERQNNLNLEYN